MPKEFAREIPMKLRQVISGGQTGADRAGLECARDLGLETGGTAPKGYRTENGPDVSLRDFGLVESHSASYPDRTRANVRNSDATIWFGTVDSPGYWCTKHAADYYTKRFWVNPTSVQMKAAIAEYEVVNVAGNRLSKNPGVVNLVKDAFAWLRPESEE